MLVYLTRYFLNMPNNIKQIFKDGVKMQTKNLVVCNYNVNMGTKIIRKINSIKRIFYLILFFLHY